MIHKYINVEIHEYIFTVLIYIYVSSLFSKYLQRREVRLIIYIFYNYLSKS